MASVKMPTLRVLTFLGRKTNTPNSNTLMMIKTAVCVIVANSCIPPQFADGLIKAHALLRQTRWVYYNKFESGCQYGEGDKLRQYRTILMAQIANFFKIRQKFRQTNQIEAGNSRSIANEICEV